MSLIRREHIVASPNESMEERIDRVFHDTVRDWFTGGALAKGLFEQKDAIRAEEDMTDGEYTLRLEIPGIDPDKDVEVTVTDGLMHVEARREDRHEEKHGHGYRTEFRYGSFERTLRLPDGVDESAIKAGYKDGILEVHVLLPDTAKKSATKVAVNHS